MLEQGAIALIPVPFTNLSSTKRRPVIVIASNEYITTTPDMIVVAMTSNPTQTPYSFTITNDDLVAGSLNRPGQVRTDKIYTLVQHIAVRVFGKVKTETIQRIVTLLHKATAVEL